MKSDHDERRKLVNVLEEVAWDPEEQQGFARDFQEMLSVDWEADEFGGCLVIGVDDTLVPDFDGGPCSGFVPMVQIHNLARFFAIGVESDTADWLMCVAEWLEDQSRSMREIAQKAKAKGDGVEAARARPADR